MSTGPWGESQLPFPEWAEPTAEQPGLFDPIPVELPEPADREIASILGEISRLDPTGARFARVFRETFDQLYDGQRTGRYAVAQLFKTEKTHFGTLIEINLQREFRFLDGAKLDYKIADVEVDCKFSHTEAWMLPQESFGEVVLLTHADDATARWSIGAVRVTAAHRRERGNQDRKVGLSPLGREAIVWLWRSAPMTPNALLELHPFVAELILAESSGQRRINELFRQAQNRRLSRNIIATVAQQADYMKRVRENGGARDQLRPEGIVIFSGDYRQQRDLAARLGATVPEPGEFVAVTLTPADPRIAADPGKSSAPNEVKIAGGWWRLHRADDPIVAAPLLPRGSNGDDEGGSGAGPGAEGADAGPNTDQLSLDD